MQDSLTIWMLAFAPLVLIVGGAVLAIAGRWLREPLVAPLSIAVAVAGLVASLWLWSPLWAMDAPFDARVENRLFTWLANVQTSAPGGGFGVVIGLRADRLAYFFGLPVAVLALLLAVYLAARKPRFELSDLLHPQRGRLVGLCLMALGFVLLAVYAAPTLLYFAALEAVGLCIYLVAGPGLRGSYARNAAPRALAASIVGGQAILAALLVVVARSGGKTDFADLSPEALGTDGSGVGLIIFGLVAVGLAVKLGLFPFQSYLGSLADSARMPGAAVASLFSSLVAVGLSLLLRLHSIVAAAPVAPGTQTDPTTNNPLGWIAPLLLPLGALTTVVAALLSLRSLGGNPRDVVAGKPVLRGGLVGATGYLVVSHIGLIVLGLGVGGARAAAAGGAAILSTVLVMLAGLIVGAPLLLFVADLMQLDARPLQAPPDLSDLTSEAAAALVKKPVPRDRPPLYRAILIILYIVAGLGMVGLPLSAAAGGRWLIIETLLTEQGGAARLYAFMLIVATLLAFMALARGLALFLRGTVTENIVLPARRQIFAAYAPLIAPVLLAAIVVAFGLFAAGLTGWRWLGVALRAIYPTSEQAGDVVNERLLNPRFYTPLSVSLFAFFALIAFGVLLLLRKPGVVRAVAGFNAGFDPTARGDDRTEWLAGRGRRVGQQSAPVATNLAVPALVAPTTSFNAGTTRAEARRRARQKALEVSTTALAVATAEGGNPNGTRGGALARNQERPTGITIGIVADDFFDPAFWEFDVRRVRTRGQAVQRSEPELDAFDFAAPLNTLFGRAFNWCSLERPARVWGAFIARLMDVVRLAIEWLTARFYAPLTFLLVLIAILLLTR